MRSAIFFQPFIFCQGKCLLANWFPDYHPDNCLVAYRLLFNNHNSHYTRDLIEYCDEHKIISYTLPAHIMYLMQSLNVILFQPLKYFHKLALENSIHSGYYDFNKVEFLAEIGKIRQQAFKKRSIIHSWHDVDLLSYNSEIILQKFHKNKLSKPSTFLQVFIPASISETTLQTLWSFKQMLMHVLINNESLAKNERFKKFMKDACI